MKQTPAMHLTAILLQWITKTTLCSSSNFDAFLLKFPNSISLEVYRGIALQSKLIHSRSRSRAIVNSASATLCLNIAASRTSLISNRKFPLSADRGRHPELREATQTLHFINNYISCLTNLYHYFFGSACSSERLTRNSAVGLNKESIGPGFSILVTIL